MIIGRWILSAVVFYVVVAVAFGVGWQLANSWVAAAIVDALKEVVR